MSRLLIALPLLAFAGAAAAAAAIAVPVSPQRTTVVAGETQVIAARFLDAQLQPVVGDNVRFFNDACGTFTGGGFVGQAMTDSSGLASIKFTALNTGFIRCTVSAGATSGASTSFDVITFRPDIVDPAIAVTIDPAEPRPGQAFRVTARPHLGQFDLYNVDVSARVIAGSASASLSGATSNSGQEGLAQFRVTPDGRIGDYEIELGYRGKLVRVPIKAPANPWQDLWWSGSAENGWGVSIAQHGAKLFAAIYVYDAQGKPTWYVLPDGTWAAGLKARSGGLDNASR
jgi:hypothetical protein